MKILFFLLVSFVSMTSTAQNDSWKIVHNGKVLLQASVENEQKNLKKLPPADLNTSGYLQINYTDKQLPKGWKRVISIFDAHDQELLKHEGNTCKITNATLRSFFTTADTLKIYTWSLPTDPNEAARIRVRRVHLCTLALQ